MRVLIVFHGWLPHDERPGSGGAVRAWNHGEALRAAGHEVLYLSRTQDEAAALSYASHRELRELARRLAPDRILCVQPEEAPALAGLGIPLAVDLYAPRLLEAGFQDQVAREAGHTLRALGAGDWFFFSNPRQRWFYLSLLSLAGVDPALGEVLPLVAPEGPPRKLPRHPLLVMGGVSWPWQDPSEGLRRAVAHLERRRKGKVVVYGGRATLGDSSVVDLPALVPPGPRLEYRGPLPYGQLLQAYASASAALDWMAPNPERELALAFRHVDYLGCGLPLITRAFHPLSQEIAASGAGWVGGELEAALDQVLDERDELELRSRAAAELGRRYRRAQAEAPLLRWVEDARVRQRVSAPLVQAAELQASAAESRARAQGAEELRDQARRELEDKRLENRELSQQVQALTSTVQRLSRSLDEVSGFKREAVAVLGREREATGEELRALTRELSELRADLQKKEAELRAARREQDRLNDALGAALDESQYKGERLIEAGTRENRLRGERDQLAEEGRRGLLGRLMSKL